MRRRFLSKQPSAAGMPPPDGTALSRRQAEALAPIELITPLAPVTAGRGETEAASTSPAAPRIYARPSLFADAPPNRARAGWSRHGRVAAATLFLLLTGTSLPLPSPDAVARTVATLLTTPAETTIERVEVAKPRAVSPVATSATTASRRGMIDLTSVAGRSMTALTARFEDAAGSSPAAAPTRIHGHVTDVPRPVEVHRRPAAVAGIPVPIPVEITAPPVRTASASMQPTATEHLPRARGTVVVTTGALLLTSNQLDGQPAPFPSLAARPQLPRAISAYPASGLTRVHPAWPSAWREARSSRAETASLGSIRNLMMVGQ